MGLVFGMGRSPQAQQYYEEGYKPLTENQTREWERRSEMGMDTQVVYDIQQKSRRIETLEREIGLIRANNNLSQEQKNKRIDKVRNEIQDIRNEITQLRAGGL